MSPLSLSTFLRVLACVNALTIISPPDLACHVDSPLLNWHLGPQSDLALDTDLSRSNVAVLEHVKFGAACSKDPLFPTNSTYALLTLYESQLRPKLVAEVECLQMRGYHGVIVLAEQFPIPGISYYDSQYSSSPVHIPVLHAASTAKLFEIAKYLESNEGLVTVRPTVSTNPWQIIWEGPLYLIAYNIILASLSGVIGLIAARGAMIHVRAMNSTLKDANSSNWLAVTGCLIEAVTSFVRVVYFAGGPFGSTPCFSHVASRYIEDMEFAIGSLTSYIAAALFIRWGAFSLKAKKNTKRLEVGLLIAGANAFFGTATVTTVEIKIGTSIAMLTAKLSLAIVILCISAFSFLIAGITLIRRLKSTSTVFRARALKKAMYWMIVASFGQFVQLAGLLFGVIDSDSARRPLGNFFVYFCTALGLTIVSAAHTMAFRPLARKETHRVQGFINHMKIGRKPPRHDNMAHAVFCEENGTMSELQLVI